MIDTTVWDTTKRQNNLANKITMSRACSVILIPIGALMESPHLLGILVFWAALSDGLDGWMARKKGEETPIGVVGDPLADKIFTDLFLIYATVITGSWGVAILAGVTLAYDIDNTYQRRLDIAGAFKGLALPQKLPATWLSKVKTALLFVFMFAVIYPQFLPGITVEQLALVCLALVLCSWWRNRGWVVPSF